MTLYTIFSKLIKPLVGSGVGNWHIVADLYQKIMPKLLPESEKIVDVQGFKMKVLTKGHINDIATELIFKGIHEPATTRVFKKILKQGDIVVDIGANVGYFTLMASQLVGWRGKVYAFEPDPTNMKLLNENARLNNLDNIQSYMMALDNHTGTDVLHTCSREPARHSLVKTKEHDGKELTLVAKLDDILSFELPKVRLLKTDTEGNELAVLQGARQTILNSKDIILIVEINFEALKVCKIEVAELIDYIADDLGMTWFYLVDDYKDNIELLYHKIKYANLPEPRGKAVLGYNLLCSREELEL